MQPAARSLILDLLSTLRGGAMPVRCLVAAGALFGIAGNSVRVALARLLARGTVERDERGQYRLGAGAGAVLAQVTSWRQLGRKTRPWGGGWIGVHEGRVGSSEARRLLHERALGFLGFRLLAPGLRLRPDNRRGGAGTVRDELQALGLEAGTLVCGLADLDPATEARARGLWDVAALRDGYRSSFRALEKSAARLPGLSAEAAMVESFGVGGRVIRQLVLDPLLPEEIAPAADREALVAAMGKYDRLGRSVWAVFLGRFGVPHRAAPADTRIGAGASRLEIAAGGPA